MKYSLDKHRETKDAIKGLEEAIKHQKEVRKRNIFSPDVVLGIDAVIADYEKQIKELKEKMREVL